MAPDIFKLFRGATASGNSAAAPDAQRVARRSNGLQELTRRLAGEAMCVLDLGPTSPQNISFFTGLGQKIYSEDLLLAGREPALLLEGPDGQRQLDVPRFMAENLQYEKELFDVVLCWDLADYLDAELVKPIVHRLCSIMKPKGLLLAFFHTRDAGPDAPYHRYHIGSHDTLQLQRIPAPAAGAPALAPGAGYHQAALAHFRLQRVFNNRHIENLFHDFASLKFFLGRDNIREVLVVR